MSNLKKLFGTNPAAEISGVWVTYGSGIRVRVARYNNGNHVIKLAALRKPHWKQLQRQDVEALTLEAELRTRAIAETVLLDWEGITEDDGTPIAYSKEKAFEFLNDPALHDFREFVFTEAMDQAKYRDEAIEDAAKNS